MRRLRTMLRIAESHEAPIPASSFETLGSRKLLRTRGYSRL